MIRFFFYWLCMWLCRRAEWIQHPPGVPLSRGGGLPENDPRGAAHPGSQKHPGSGPTPAVWCLHVHVPEPDHEPVQIESCPQPPTLHSSATPPPPLPGQEIPRKTKKWKINWQKKGCLPAGVLSGVNPLGPTSPQCLPISGGWRDGGEGEKPICTVH